ncbi:MAG: PhoH family protein, partial [Gammaproteobacteria bacterium]
MAKYTRSRSRSNGKKTRRRSDNEIIDHDGVVIDINTFTPLPPDKHLPRHPHHPLIQARNRAQGDYMAAINTHQLTFGLGPAGTGKTFCATAMAVEAFERRQIDRIIFCRPAIESGESLGFLPGKLQEKLEPWFSTFRAYLNDMLGRGIVDCALKNERIVFEP